MAKLIFALAAFLGITLTVTVTVGPYLFGVSQTPKGETRVSHAISVENVQKGMSSCASGCKADSKPEKFEALDLNPAGDGLALSLVRTNGQVTTEYGLAKSFSAFDGKFGVTIVATRSTAGADIVDSWPVRAVLPTGLRKKAKSWLGEPKPTFVPKTPGQSYLDEWQLRERQRQFAQAWPEFRAQNSKVAGDKNLDVSRALQSLAAKKFPSRAGRLAP